MEALFDEWVLPDLENASKSYSRCSYGNCSIIFRQGGNECSCCEEMEKCTSIICFVTQQSEASTLCIAKLSICEFLNLSYTIM